MEFTIAQIAAMIQGEIDGNGQEKVNTIGKIQDAAKGAITFLSNPKYEKFIYTTEATAVIVKNDFIPAKPIKPTLIRVEDPYSSFTRLLEEYDKISSYGKVGVEEPSFISTTTTVGEKLIPGCFFIYRIQCEVRA